MDSKLSQWIQSYHKWIQSCHNGSAIRGAANTHFVLQSTSQQHLKQPGAIRKNQKQRF